MDWLLMTERLPVREAFNYLDRLVLLFVLFRSDWFFGVTLEKTRLNGILIALMFALVFSSLVKILFNIFFFDRFLVVLSLLRTDGEDLLKEVVDLHIGLLFR